MQRNEPARDHLQTDSRSRPRRRTCMVIITHQCNLNCRYCYEAFKSTQAIPLHLAQRIIEAEFDMVAHSPEFDEIALDLTGGEPLLRFDLMRQIAEWLWSQPRAVPYLLSSTTNGTLLSEEMKQWFSRYRDRVYLTLSLDGTPAMQKINRGLVIDPVDIGFFVRTWPTQSIKMTVSCQTLCTMAQGIIYLQERGIPLHANLGYGMPWKEKDVQEYGRQLRILAEYYLEHPDIEPVSLLSLPLEHVLAPAPDEQAKYCGTGTNMVAYEVDGRRYPCHMFTPLVLGEDKALALGAVDFADPAVVTDPKCRACILCSLCSTCYGFNYKTMGNVATREPIMCRFFAVQTQMNCWFRTRQFQRKRQAGPLSVEDIRVAKACLEIAESLSV